MHSKGSISRQLMLLAVAVFCLATTFFLSYTAAADTSLSSLQPKSLTVGMHASSWHHSPLLLQTAEHVSVVRPTLYGEVLDRINATLTQHRIQWTDRTEYTISLQIAQHMIGAAALSLLSHALLLGQQSVKIALFQQTFADECKRLQYDITAKPCANGHYIAFNGAIHCALADIDFDAELNESNAMETFAFDHRFVPHTEVSNGTSALPTVILYGDIRQASMYETHYTLLQRARRGLIDYIFRPHYDEGAFRSTPHSLFGWGIELAIKNMEYKVLDDSPVDTSNASNADGADVDVSHIKSVGTSIYDHMFPPEDLRDDAAAEQKMFHHDLFTSAQREEKQLKEYQIKELSLAAAAVIVTSADPLRTMASITALFPQLQTTLSNVQVTRPIRNALRANSQSPLPPASTAVMSIQGQTFDITDLDIYTLHTILYNEAINVDSLSQLHLQSQSLQTVLEARRIVSREDAQLNMYTRGEDNGKWLLNMGLSNITYNNNNNNNPVIWLNDISKDKRYKQWPPSVQEFLTPSWGNQLKYVRANVYTGIIIFDPSTIIGLSYFHQANFFLKNNAPIRLAITFSIPKDTGGIQVISEWDNNLLDRTLFTEFIQLNSNTTKPLSVQAVIAILFYDIIQRTDLEAALEYLEELYRQETDITVTKARDIYEQLVDNMKTNDIDALLVSPISAELVERIQAYTADHGLLHNDEPLLILNGLVISSGTKDFRTMLMESLYNEQRKAGLRVYLGIINDRTDFTRYWETQSNAYERYSSYIIRPPADMTFASELLPVVTASSSAPSLAYFHTPHPEQEFTVKGITYWVIADWATADGLSLVYAALNHLVRPDPQYACRMAFIHHRALNTTSDPYYAGRLAAAITQSTMIKSKQLLYIRKIVALTHHLIHTNTAMIHQALQKLIATTPQLSKFAAHMSESPPQITLNPAVSDKFISTLQLTPGHNAVVANGYIVQFPTDQTAHDVACDLRLLDVYVDRVLLSTLYTPLVEKVTFVDMDADDQTTEWYSEVAMRISYAMSIRTHKLTNKPQLNAAVWPQLDATNTKSMIVVDNPHAWININAVFDPLTKEGQRVAPILLSLRETFNVSMRIWLNPQLELKELPLKRYYQYAGPSQFNFDSDGSIVPYTGVTFSPLLTHAVLTATVDTPESWLIALRIAAYDLDNLRLESFGAVEHSTVLYELENLLINGQCFDHDTQPPSPPSGLQLTLHSPSHPYAGDTVVMQNLGFFQLKAAPGVWQLSFADRHAEIYEYHPTMNGHRNVRDLSVHSIVVASLNDPYIRLTVRRRPGQESVELLDTKPAEKIQKKTRNSYFAQMMGLAVQEEEEEEEKVTAEVTAGGDVGSSTDSITTSNSTLETVHIFSLASGHLYERFLKIMILSVIKHTSHPVKFWFIRNFASPQFVTFIPEMAKQYGFQVEFVTYKWPIWLRRQTEKQRVIWGYKILFLDVLWPLAIRRVIYIDADQVVRGDVHELWTMDLGGAPYAYTPFCDSNTDTEGFRFWKSGYWKDHLRGKKYHISALYVIDLTVFRALRAGDSLRSIYDNLSQDPNSLANLDQDLPNYTQHMVPIHSLPLEWLWCQTWCSMDTLDQAKTIDLCNNPLTKTPKLDVAKQLIPEWIDYDNEARSLDVTLSAHNKTNNNNTQPNIVAK